MTGQIWDVKRRLRRVISSVLGVDEDRIESTDGRETIPEWTSLGHLQLMMALEDEFQIQFQAEELASFGSVAQLEERLGAGEMNG